MSSTGSTPRWTYAASDRSRKGNGFCWRGATWPTDPDLDRFRAPHDGSAGAAPVRTTLSRAKDHLVVSLGILAKSHLGTARARSVMAPEQRTGSGVLFAPQQRSSH